MGSKTNVYLSVNVYMNNPLCAKEPIITNSNKLEKHIQLQDFIQMKSPYYLR